MHSVGSSLAGVARELSGLAVGATEELTELLGCVVGALELPPPQAAIRTATGTASRAMERTFFIQRL
jgi:hypothetical protein